MTKSKKSIVMHGMLLCPLVLGHCAFLRANGSDYRDKDDQTGKNTSEVIKGER